MEKYDVIVVGGGPGGSVAAMTAAGLGLKTIVLERGTRPGEKNVSGTGLSPKCFRDFEFMKEMKLPHERVATMATLHLSDDENVEKLSFSFTPSERAAYPEAREFLTVNVYRSELDPWLFGLAADAGAETRTSTRISCVVKDDAGRITGVRTDSGETIAGDIIIGADGVISTVARTAGIREKWDPSEVAMIINIDFGAARADIDEVIGGNALHYWYSSVFPVGYSFFSAEGFHVGLGNYVSWWKKSPHYYLNRMFEIEGVRRQIRQCRGVAREFQNHMVTFLTNPATTYGDSVLLVGDAAGFACPFEAEGVYYAMYSGMLAGKVAAEALSSGDVSRGFLSRYESAWRDSPVGEEFVGGEAIDGFVRGIGFNPEAGRWVIPMLNDAAFGLLNVAESHTASARNLPRLLLPYLPELARELKEDLLPLSARMVEQPRRPARPGLVRLMQKALPRILPPLARFAARRPRSAYGEYAGPLLAEHFLTPYAEERISTLEEVERG
ncbi:MAG: NAD(P)/FAD-dependent oxidoreductase [Actinomycetota bacterium]